MKRYLPFIIIAAVLVVAVGALFFLKSKPNAPASAVLTGVPGAEPPHVRGGANAQVTLEEFGDYQCPPCGLLYPELAKIEHDYGDRLRLVFRQFPLPTTHPYAMMAAHAAEAAGMQNRFWEMHDQLYKNQKSWSRAPDPRAVIKGYAQELGLDVDRFTRDMDGPDADARVVADHTRAMSLNVKGTPTLFINGREWQPPQDSDPLINLRATIEAAMNGK